MDFKLLGTAGAVALVFPFTWALLHEPLAVAIVLAAAVLALGVLGLVLRKRPLTPRDDPGLVSLESARASAAADRRDAGPRR